MTTPIGDLSPSSTAGFAVAPARPLLVLNLRGSQEEMGAQHGRLLCEHDQERGQSRADPAR